MLILSQLAGDDLLPALLFRTSRAQCDGDVERLVERESGCKTIVHVDPVDRTHPMYARARKCLKEIVAKDPRIVRFHDLRVSGEDGSFDLSVDVVVPISIQESSYEEISGEVKNILAQCMDGIRAISVVVEPAYAEETSY